MKALELVREVRDELETATESGDCAHYSLIHKLDAALAELERDQAFIEAGERAASAREAFGDLSYEYQAATAAMQAAYRARREERGNP